MAPTSKHLTASQVGQYAYCALAWWLGEVEGHPRSDLRPLEAGVEAHEGHGWRVAWARGFRRLALALVAGAVFVLLAWLALGAAG